MVIIDDIEQQSEEWFKIKAGVPGASSFNRIVTPKGEPSDSRQDYLYELAGERISGFQEEGYTSYDMRKGIEMEPEARLCYEYVTGDIARQVGFVFMDTNHKVGCSPDALIFDPDDLNDPVTGLEIRCGKMKTHVKQLLTGDFPKDKFQQIHGSMWVCGFHSWEFIAYHPRMPEFRLTVRRDYKFTSALEVEMTMFLDELDEIYNELKEKA